MIRRLSFQLFAVTLLASATLAWQARVHGGFLNLWLTPDQQARRAFEQNEFQQAFDAFEDPAWKGVAGYRAGRYAESAESFGRIPTAAGFYNRGNAFMKSRDYRKAVTAYEQAVADAPTWVAAQDNLRLARHVVEYIERLRDQTDTGDDSEMGADDYVFDNTRERGVEIQITRESTIALESAEKWMRAVDTQTRDFLRTRFLLEAVRAGQR